MIDETINLKNFIFSDVHIVNEWLRYVAEKTNWFYQLEDLNLWGKLYINCGDLSFTFTINRLANVIAIHTNSFFSEEVQTKIVRIEYKTTKDVIDFCLEIGKEMKEIELKRKKKEINRDFVSDDLI